MHYEVEQKFPLTGREPLVTRLSSLGAAFLPPIAQVDSYFAHPSRDFAQTDEALRIRRVGEANYVTYKGPKLDPLTKTRRELELPIAGGETGFEQFAELLLALGFRRVADVRKARTPGTLPWRQWQVELALDEVQEVGLYLELELSADESRLDEARAVLGELTRELGLETTERRSYLELLLRSQAGAGGLK